MNVFLSWSGETSEAIAKVLRDWLPQVINAVKPWVSSADIGKGQRWNAEIAAALGSVKIGVFCLTADNLTAPWLLFEAGAISKTVSESHVCTYLFDVRKSDVTLPLSQFQATVCDRLDSQKLVETINAALGQPLTEAQVRKAYEKWWPDLEQELGRIRSSQRTPKTAPPKRTTDELLEEILSISRQLAANAADAEVRLGGMLDSVIGRYLGYVDNSIASALGEPLQTDRTGILGGATPEFDRASRILPPPSVYRARRNNLPRTPSKEK